ncbi:glycosyltransferase family 2 protein [Cernens ardua]|uniref:glycosyltransferase family 2 protein n=1 Tax=Cernens ardua TaxID=3402176 RepID=UPI003F96FBCE
MKNTGIQACVLVVNRNQEAWLPDLLKNLAPLNLPVLVIDDGSEAEHLESLEKIVNQYEVELVRLLQKTGKGTATRTGLDEAQRLGYSHVLLHEIDTYYSEDDIQGLLELGAQSPDVLYYSASPDNNGKDITLGHRLTASTAFSPAMRYIQKGLRLYPIRTVNALLTHFPCGRGYEFDTELLIRWSWKGLPTAPYVIAPLKASENDMGVAEYPAMLKMHIQTMIGMSLRLPWLLKRQSNNRKRLAE